MRVKKAINKVIALGIGAGMLGATLMGAMAASDLKDFPQPFVKGGVFDGVIVVGDDAAPKDIVGAIDVAASLQYAMKVKTTASVSTGTPTVTIDKGVKIEKTGNHLNYEEYLSNVRDSALDDTDFTDILADGTYDESKGENSNKVDYTQTIQLPTGGDRSGKLTFYQDDQDAPTADTYLALQNNKQLYIYNLDFDESVQYGNSSSTSVAAADLQNTYLTIEGQLYTITDVSVSNRQLNKLTMLAGDTIIWLAQDHVITRTIGGVDHEVQVVDVSSDETKCGISVDGTTVWVDVGDTKTINGVNIGVTDAVAVNTQLEDTDICEVNLGARQVILENGKEVKVGGKSIDNSKVVFELTNDDPLKWEGFNISYKTDEQYLKPGESFVDPVFGVLEFRYEGLSQETEDISIDIAGSKSAEMTFTNNDGKLVEVPFFWNSTTTNVGRIIPGKDSDNMLFQEGERCQNDCDSAMFWVITSGNTAHLMEITNIDTSAPTNVDIKDHTYDKNYNDKKITMNAVAQPISLGAVGTIQLAINSTGTSYVVNFTDIELQTAGTYAKTKHEGEVWFTGIHNGSLLEYPYNTTIYFKEASTAFDDLTATNNQSMMNTTFWWDTVDGEIELSGSGKPACFQEGPTGAWNGMTTVCNPKTYDVSDTDNKNKKFTTPFGTLIWYDNDSPYERLKITYPKDEVYGNVFLAPIGATVIKGGSGGSVETLAIEKINVGAAKLASEVANPKTLNVISVGGPAINKVSATLMGLPYPSYGAASGISENTGILKLVENDGKVALVVAGWSAEDTQRASRVLADYQDYALSGAEMVVTGTSLTDISVSAPSAESTEEATE